MPEVKKIPLARVLAGYPLQSSRGYVWVQGANDRANYPPLFALDLQNGFFLTPYSGIMDYWYGCGEGKLGVIESYEAKAQRIARNKPGRYDADAWEAQFAVYQPNELLERLTELQSSRKAFEQELSKVPVGDPIRERVKAKLSADDRERIALTFLMRYAEVLPTKKGGGSKK